MRYTLDVVIVNWNSGEQLMGCLVSLAQATADLVELSRVVVIDNASTDGSANNLIGLGLPLEVIRNRSNIGFGAAVNQGVRGSSAHALLLLNPDTRLEVDSLYKPLAFLADTSHSDVGIVGIQLIGDDGEIQRSCARIPSAITLVGRSLGFHRLSMWRDYVMTEWDHSETREVEHVIGAFYMVRRSAFEALGGLDERFFVYLEDLDFSARARAAGWRIFFLKEARAYHKGCGTSGNVASRRLYYSLESRILYSYKHHSRLAASFVCAATLFVEPAIRVLQALWRRSGNELVEVVRGYRLLWHSMCQRVRSSSKSASGPALPQLRMAHEADGEARKPR